MAENKKATVVEQIYTALRGKILAGEYPSGMPLRQDELAAAYKASRIPVREALIQLSSEGLVKFIPFKGAQVASLSIEELMEIFEVRYAMESLALKYTIAAITEADVRRLEKMLQNAQQEVDSRDQLMDANWEFHRELYMIGGKPRLLEIIASQYAKVDRYIRIFLSTEAARGQSIVDHSEILRACGLKDAIEATVLLHEHMCLACDNLCRLLSHDNPDAVKKVLSLVPPVPVLSRK